MSLPTRLTVTSQQSHDTPMHMRRGGLQRRLGGPISRMQNSDTSKSHVLMWFSHRREVRLSDNGGVARYNASRGTAEIWRPYQGTPRGRGTHQDTQKGVCLPRGCRVTAQSVIDALKRTSASTASDRASARPLRHRLLNSKYASWRLGRWANLSHAELRHSENRMYVVFSLRFSAWLLLFTPAG